MLYNEKNELVISQNFLSRCPAGSIVVGFPEVLPSKKSLQMIEEFNFAGVIIFSHNFTSIKNLRAAIRVLRIANSKIQILIDQEGGDKCRIKEPPYYVPSPTVLSKWSNFRVREVYKLSAEALAELGITINLAPIAGIGTGKYIKNRTFSSDPETTAEKVVASIEGIYAGGLMACPKHFPGLGSVDEDPHLRLPVSNISSHEFFDRHFVPFKAAIDAGVDLIMTTHLLAKSLDSKYPATYSKKITAILRDDLKFKGKILSDDLALMAGANQFSPEERIEKTLDSGHDIALFCSI